MRAPNNFEHPSSSGPWKIWKANQLEPAGMPDQFFFFFTKNSAWTCICQHLPRICTPTLSIIAVHPGRSKIFTVAARLY